MWKIFCQTHQQHCVGVSGSVTEFLELMDALWAATILGRCDGKCMLMRLDRLLSWLISKVNKWKKWLNERTLSIFHVNLGIWGFWWKISHSQLIFNSVICCYMILFWNATIPQGVFVVSFKRRIHCINSHSCMQEINILDLKKILFLHSTVLWNCCAPLDLG